MKKFETFTGIVAPLDRSNVDTDTIIPKQYLKSIKKTGFGVNLFDDWRYLDPGQPGDDHRQRRLNPDFVLNQPRYQGAGILLARENFGCGSSREHAVWALLDYGIHVVVAPSFGDIFYSNAFKNGLLPVTLEHAEVDQLFQAVDEVKGLEITADLEHGKLTTSEGKSYQFEINNGLKDRLLKGLDDIGITLQFADEIRAYEAERRQTMPWLFR